MTRAAPPRAALPTVVALLIGASLLNATPSPADAAAASAPRPIRSGDDTIRAGDADVLVESRGAAADVGTAGLQDWVRASAGIVRGYYREFPVRRVRVRITVVDGAKVMSGTTFGWPDAHIDVSVGRHVTAAALHDDWVLVHEMIHLAAPALPAEQNWLSEGLATYVEGVARVQAGNLAESALWAEYLVDMPQGLPRAGDLGLDRTHTWARTYWGGALFCLVADVRIRERTGNRTGLRDALRAIARSGGGMQAHWTALQLMQAGDRATGTTVLTELYAAMKDRPYAPDLAGLWADLGIAAGGDGAGVLLDDTARLAATRRAITAAAPDRHDPLPDSR